MTNQELQDSINRTHMMLNSTLAHSPLYEPLCENLRQLLNFQVQRAQKVKHALDAEAAATPIDGPTTELEAFFSDQLMFSLSTTPRWHELDYHQKDALRTICKHISHVLHSSSRSIQCWKAIERHASLISNQLIEAEQGATPT